MQQATILAVMADETVIVEHVTGFWAFIDMALAFRADPDCVRMSWYVEDCAIAAQEYADWLAFERDMRGFVADEARSYGLAVA